MFKFVVRSMLIVLFFTSITSEAQISMQNAIQIARTHVKQNKIDITKFNIVKTEYIKTPAQIDKPFWRVFWEHKAPLKMAGGWFVVLVGSDGKATIEHGE